MNDQAKPRNISTQLNLYIPPSHQLQQPRGHRPLSKEEAATVVVDEIWLLYKTFKHTHLKADLLKIVTRALYLESLGYQLVLLRRQDCVGATKKEVKCSNVH